MHHTPTELKQQFDLDGYVVVRNFVSGSELQSLERNLEHYITDVVPTLPPSDAFYQDSHKPETLTQLQHMQQHSEFFNDYAHHPQWMDLATTLLGEPAHCQGPEWFNKPPNTQHPTPPHQDNYYFCLEPCHVLTLWLALDAIDEENGCLRYYRGSHLHGLVSHEASSVLGFSQGIQHIPDSLRTRETPVPTNPGDLLVHHGATIHRADANLSTHRQRRAFAMVYRGQSCQINIQRQREYQQALKKQHAAINPNPI